MVSVSGVFRRKSLSYKDSDCSAGVRARSLSSAFAPPCCRSCGSVWDTCSRLEFRLNTCPVYPTRVIAFVVWAAFLSLNLFGFFRLLGFVIFGVFNFSVVCLFLGLGPC